MYRQWVQNESEGSWALYYELYIDSLFFTDFIMNFYVLSLTSRICGRSATRLRRLISAAYGSGIYCITFFLPWGWLPGKIIGGLLFSAVGMTKIAFGDKAKIPFMKLLPAMAGAAFFQGGIFLFVKNQFPTFWGNRDAALCALVIGGASYGAGCFVIEKNKKRNQSFCQVVLQNGLKEVEVNALVDTGNFLIEPFSGKPVSILEENVLLELFDGSLPEYYRVVPFSSIGKKKGMLKCFEIPRMWVEYQDDRRCYEKVYIACNSELISTDACPMILNPKLINNQEEKENDI